MLKVCALTRTVQVLLVAALGLVCLAQQGLPDHSAKVIVQIGRLSARSDNGLLPLSVGDTLKPQQLIVTGPDGYGQFQVADGSTFEVFANSEVIFREHPGDLQTIMNVLIGHIKVYIQHLNGLPNYNHVESPTAVISVRGTVFEVVVEDQDGTTYVQVEEGIVGVKNSTAVGGEVELHRGDSIRVIRNAPLQARVLNQGGGVMRAVLRAAEEAVYQVMRQPGGIGRLPGPTVTPSGNGDTGKGSGGGSAPSAPGAPHQ